MDMTNTEEFETELSHDLVDHQTMEELGEGLLSDPRTVGVLVNRPHSPIFRAIWRADALTDILVTAKDRPTVNLAVDPVTLASGHLTNYVFASVWAPKSVHLGLGGQVIALPAYSHASGYLITLRRCGVDYTTLRKTCLSMIEDLHLILKALMRSSWGPQESIDGKLGHLKQCISTQIRPSFPLRAEGMQIMIETFENSDPAETGIVLDLMEAISDLAMNPKDVK